MKKKVMAALLATGLVLSECIQLGITAKIINNIQDKKYEEAMRQDLDRRYTRQSEDTDESGLAHDINMGFHYGCPNSKRVKKLNLLKNLRKIA